MVWVSADFVFGIIYITPSDYIAFPATRYLHSIFGGQPALLPPKPCRGGPQGLSVWDLQVKLPLPPTHIACSVSIKNCITPYPVEEFLNFFFKNKILCLLRSVCLCMCVCVCLEWGFFYVDKKWSSGIQNSVDSVIYLLESLLYPLCVKTLYTSLIPDNRSRIILQCYPTPHL